MSRNTKEINQEYTDLCARLGQLEYHKSCIERDVALLFNSLRDLAIEGAAVAAAEAAAPKAE